MLRKWLIAAWAVIPLAWGQAPVYTRDSVVNSSDYSPAPFAPNSVVSIFGTNLSWSTGGPAAVKGGTLATQAEGVQVFVDNYPAPLLYVSPTQINFIVPSNEIPGNATLRVAREGVSGPLVVLPLVDAAPALFSTDAAFILAEHADCSLIGADSPAHAGDIVVIYATGLGHTQPNPNPGEVPQTPAIMVAIGSLTVYLDGVALPAYQTKYAGVTPFWAGLYQINLELPLHTTGPDPEIRVGAGAQLTPAGLYLRVQ